MNTSQQYWKTNVILLYKAHKDWYTFFNSTNSTYRCVNYVIMSFKVMQVII